MPLSTYSELVTAVADWLWRSDLAAQVPDYIALAEAKLRRRGKQLRGGVVRATFTVASQFTDLPADFDRAETLTHSDALLAPIQFRSLADALALRQQNTALGKPRWWTIVGDEAMMVPAPDQSYSPELIYYSKLVALVTTPTNWLLTNHPDVYLYGSLLEAAPYLKDDDRVMLWKSRFDDAILELNIASDRSTVAGTPVAMVTNFG